MKNLILLFTIIFLFGCKGSQIKTIEIDASKEEVWNTISQLGNLSDWGGLDSSALTPPGIVTEGASFYVSQGKNYAISEVVVVEDLKTIKTKLVEATWPVHYWNESMYISEGGDYTILKYQIDFQGKGAANLAFPILSVYNGSDMSKTLKNIKKEIESK